MELKQVRREARRICAQNRLSLCLLCAIFLLFAIGLEAVRAKYALFVTGAAGIILRICTGLLALAATAPLAVGSYEWIMKMTLGKSTPMKNAFGRFSDWENIFSALKAFFWCFICSIVSLAPFCIMLALAQSLDDLLFVILAAILSAKLSCAAFLLPHIMLNAPHISYITAVKLALKAMHGRLGEFCRLMAEHMFLIAISYIMLWLPLILFMPYMMCSYVVYCDAVFEESGLYKYNLYY